MAPGGGWDEAVAKNLEAGFYNHCFCPIGPEGPAYCIWEVREGISAEEFQEFIDGPNGVNFGLGAWLNICREINLELAGTPLTPGSSESPLMSRGGLRGGYAQTGPSPGTRSRTQPGLMLTIAMVSSRITWASLGCWLLVALST